MGGRGRLGESTLGGLRIGLRLEGAVWGEVPAPVILLVRVRFFIGEGTDNSGDKLRRRLRFLFKMPLDDEPRGDSISSLSLPDKRPEHLRRRWLTSEHSR